MSRLTVKRFLTERIKKKERKRKHFYEKLKLKLKTTTQNVLLTSGLLCWLRAKQCFGLILKKEM